MFAAVVGVASRLTDALADARAPWLVAALLLHVAGQAARAMAWRAVLRPSWPLLTRRRVCAWYLCGAGLGGVLSARGGDAVRMALARRELPGATWPALAGTLVAEGSFETVYGIALAAVALWLGLGAVDPPSLVLIAALALAAPPAALLARRSARVRRLVAEVGRGLTVLRRPRRWLCQVLPWQVAARMLRLGSAACFLLAFGLPAAPAIVVAACAAQGSGGMLPLPGAGPATVAATLLMAVPAAAGHPVDAAAVSALAMVQPLALTAVGVTVSLALGMALLGARTPRALVRAARSLPAAPSPATP